MPMDKNETWKDIEGYEGLYQISDIGNVKTLKRIIVHEPRNYTAKEKILKPSIQNGYYTVGLHKNKHVKYFRVHRLIAIAFIPNVEHKECVNHMDCNRLNNSICNLEWVTKGENNQHAWDNFRQEKLRQILKNGLRKRKVAQLDNLGNIIKIFDSIKTARECLKICSSHISDCCNGKYGRKTCGGYIWKYIN